MATRQHPATIARRFRLFAFAKDFMDEHQRSPTVRAAMEALDIEDRHSAAVQYDFRKLRRADGLPFELRSLYDRRETTGLNLTYEIPLDQLAAGLRMRRIELGKAACRTRVCQAVDILWVAV